MEQIIIPQIAVMRSGTETCLNPYSYEYSYNRTIYLIGTIDDAASMAVVAQIRTLQSISEDDITIVINSPGGSVTAGKAIIDAMLASPCNITTECIGIAASMAAVILACGSRGRRTIHPHSEVMIHQPLGGFSGQASDVSIMCEHIAKTKVEIIHILSENTGRDVETIRLDIDRDNWMDAVAAVKYGICDSIVRRANV